MDAPLYNARILRLAASIPHADRLKDPQATARRTSQICGSRVMADVVLEADGRIAAFGQEVRACALGQASATVLGRDAVGRTRTEIAEARDALAAMLKEGGPPPDPPFADLGALVAARDHANRHGSILLAWDAALAAIDAAAA